MELMFAGKMFFWIIGICLGMAGLTYLYGISSSPHRMTTTNQDALIALTLAVAGITAFLGLMVPVRMELQPVPKVYEVVDLTDRTFVRLNSYTKVITDTRVVAQVHDPKLQTRVMHYSNLYNMGGHSRALVFVKIFKE